MIIESLNSNRMNMDILTIVFSAVVAFGMNGAYMVVQTTMPDSPDWVQLLTSPFGGFIFALIVVYVVYKALMAQQKKNDKLQQEMIDSKDEIIDTQKKEITFLEQEMKNLNAKSK